MNSLCWTLFKKKGDAFSPRKWLLYIPIAHLIQADYIMNNTAGTS